MKIKLKKRYVLLDTHWKVLELTRPIFPPCEFHPILRCTLIYVHTCYPDEYYGSVIDASLRKSSDSNDGTTATAAALTTASTTTTTTTTSTTSNKKHYDIPIDFTPLHQRRFTPHSYFSNTLRDVVAASDNVVVVIPQQQTEMHLRKSMFKIYKENSIRNLKEYERRLQQLIERETRIQDVMVNQWIAKRYLFLKSVVSSSVEGSARIVAGSVGGNVGGDSSDKKSAAAMLIDTTTTTTTKTVGPSTDRPSTTAAPTPAVFTIPLDVERINDLRTSMYQPNVGGSTAGPSTSNSSATPSTTESAGTNGKAAGGTPAPSTGSPRKSPVKH